jgi:hypothetical protein
MLGIEGTDVADHDTAGERIVPHATVIADGRTQDAPRLDGPMRRMELDREATPDGGHSNPSALCTVPREMSNGQLDSITHAASYRRTVNLPRRDPRHLDNASRLLDHLLLPELPGHPARALRVTRMLVGVVSSEATKGWFDGP